MAGVVKLIVAVEEEKARALISECRLSDLDTMPSLHHKIKDIIRECIADNIGYNNTPIAGLSRYNGEPSDLKTVGTNLNEFLPINPNNGSTVLFELQMPQDMVVSVSYEKLLFYSNHVRNAIDDDDASLYLEEFSEGLQLGYSESEDEEMISFIPFIDLKRCKFYARINPSWDISDFNVPGVEQIRLNQMEIF
jgi:hypothetical protein